MGGSPSTLRFEAESQAQKIPKRGEKTWKIKFHPWEKIPTKNRENVVQNPCGQRGESLPIPRFKAEPHSQSMHKRGGGTLAINPLPCEKILEKKIEKKNHKARKNLKDKKAILNQCFIKPLGREPRFPAKP